MALGSHQFQPPSRSAGTATALHSDDDDSSSGSDLGGTAGAASRTANKAAHMSSAHAKRHALPQAGSPVSAQAAPSASAAASAGNRAQAKKQTSAAEGDGNRSSSSSSAASTSSEGTFFLGSDDDGAAAAEAAMRGGGGGDEWWEENGAGSHVGRMHSAGGFDVYRHREVLPFFEDIIDVIIDKRTTLGDLQREWQVADGMLECCRLLTPADTSHPLLTAVHRYRVEFVGFLLQQGCDPLQAGSVRPYSGDELMGKGSDNENLLPMDLAGLMKVRGVQPQKMGKISRLLQNAILNPVQPPLREVATLQSAPAGTDTAVDPSAAATDTTMVVGGYSDPASRTLLAIVTAGAGAASELDANASHAAQAASDAGQAAVEGLTDRQRAMQDPNSVVHEMGDWYRPPEVTERFGSLVYACQAGDLDEVDDELRSHSDLVQAAAQEGPESANHPLLHAVQHCQLEIIRRLVRAGFSAELQGTLHPLPSDDCRPDELQKIHALQLAKLMIGKFQVAGNTRKRKMFEAVLEALTAGPPAAISHDESAKGTEGGVNIMEGGVESLERDVAQKPRPADSTSSQQLATDEIPSAASAQESSSLAAAKLQQPANGITTPGAEHSSTPAGAENEQESTDVAAGEMLQGASDAKRSTAFDWNVQEVLRQIASADRADGVGAATVAARESKSMQKLDEKRRRRAKKHKKGKRRAAHAPADKGASVESSARVGGATRQGPAVTKVGGIKHRRKVVRAEVQPTVDASSSDGSDADATGGRVMQRDQHPHLAIAAVDSDASGTDGSASSERASSGDNSDSDDLWMFRMVPAADLAHGPRFSDPQRSRQQSAAAARGAPGHRRGATTEAIFDNASDDSDEMKRTVQTSMREHATRQERFSGSSTFHPIAASSFYSAEALTASTPRSVQVDMSHQPRLTLKAGPRVAQGASRGQAGHGNGAVLATARRAARGSGTTRRKARSSHSAQPRRLRLDSSSASRADAHRSASKAARRSRAGGRGIGPSGAARPYSGGGAARRGTVDLNSIPALHPETAASWNTILPQMGGSRRRVEQPREQQPEHLNSQNHGENSMIDEEDSFSRACVQRHERLMQLLESTQLGSAVPQPNPSSALMPAAPGVVIDLTAEPCTEADIAPKAAASMPVSSFWLDDVLSKNRVLFKRGQRVADRLRALLPDRSGPTAAARLVSAQSSSVSPNAHAASASLLPHRQLGAPSGLLQVPPPAPPTSAARRPSVVTLASPHAQLLLSILSRAGTAGEASLPASVQRVVSGNASRQDLKQVLQLVRSVSGGEQATAMRSDNRTASVSTGELPGATATGSVEAPAGAPLLHAPANPPAQRGPAQPQRNTQAAPPVAMASKPGAKTGSMSAPGVLTAAAKQATPAPLRPAAQPSLLQSRLAKVMALLTTTQEQSSLGVQLNAVPFSIIPQSLLPASRVAPLYHWRALQGSVASAAEDGDVRGLALVLGKDAQSSAVSLDPQETGRIALSISPIVAFQLYSRTEELPVTTDDDAREILVHLTRSMQLVLEELRGLEIACACILEAARGACSVQIWAACCEWGCDLPSCALAARPCLSNSEPWHINWLQQSESRAAALLLQLDRILASLLLVALSSAAVLSPAGMTAVAADIHELFVDAIVEAGLLRPLLLLNTYAGVRYISAAQNTADQNKPTHEASPGLSSWTLHAACRCLFHWRRAMLALGPQQAAATAVLAGQLVQALLQRCPGCFALPLATVRNMQVWSRATNGSSYTLQAPATALLSCLSADCIADIIKALASGASGGKPTGIAQWCDPLQATHIDGSAELEPLPQASFSEVALPLWELLCACTIVHMGSDIAPIAAQTARQMCVGLGFSSHTMWGDGPTGNTPLLGAAASSCSVQLAGPSAARTDVGASLGAAAYMRRKRLLSQLMGPAWQQLACRGLSSWLAPCHPPQPPQPRETQGSSGAPADIEDEDDGETQDLSQLFAGDLHGTADGSVEADAAALLRLHSGIALVVQARCEASNDADRLAAVLATCQDLTTGGEAGASVLPWQLRLCVGFSSLACSLQLARAAAVVLLAIQGREYTDLDNSTVIEGLAWGLQQSTASESPAKAALHALLQTFKSAVHSNALMSASIRQIQSHSVTQLRELCPDAARFSLEEKTAVALALQLQCTSNALQLAYAFSQEPVRLGGALLNPVLRMIGQVVPACSSAAADLALGLEVVSLPACLDAEAVGQGSPGGHSGHSSFTAVCSLPRLDTAPVRGVHSLRFVSRSAQVPLAPMQQALLAASAHSNDFAHALRDLSGYPRSNHARKVLLGDWVGCLLLQLAQSAVGATQGGASRMGPHMRRLLSAWLGKDILDGGAFFSSGVLSTVPNEGQLRFSTSSGWMLSQQTQALTQLPPAKRMDHAQALLKDIHMLKLPNGSPRAACGLTSALATCVGTLSSGLVDTALECIRSSPGKTAQAISEELEQGASRLLQQVSGGLNLLVDIWKASQRQLGDEWGAFLAAARAFVVVASDVTVTNHSVNQCIQRACADLRKIAAVRPANSTGEQLSPESARCMQQIVMWLEGGLAAADAGGALTMASMRKAAAPSAPDLAWRTADGRRLGPSGRAQEAAPAAVPATNQRVLSSSPAGSFSWLALNSASVDNVQGPVLQAVLRLRRALQQVRWRLQVTGFLSAAFVHAIESVLFPPKPTTSATSHIQWCTATLVVQLALQRSGQLCREAAAIAVGCGSDGTNLVTTSTLPGLTTGSVLSRAQLLATQAGLQQESSALVGSHIVPLHDVLAPRPLTKDTVMPCPRQARMLRLSGLIVRLLALKSRKRQRKPRPVQPSQDRLLSDVAARSTLLDALSARFASHAVPAVASAGSLLWRKEASKLHSFPLFASAACNASWSLLARQLDCLAQVAGVTAMLGSFALTTAVAPLETEALDEMPSSDVLRARLLESIGSPEPAASPLVQQPPPPIGAPGNVSAIAAFQESEDDDFLLAALSAVEAQTSATARPPPSVASEPPPAVTPAPPQAKQASEAEASAAFVATQQLARVGHHMQVTAGGKLQFNPHVQWWVKFNTLNAAGHGTAGPGSQSSVASLVIQASQQATPLLCAVEQRLARAVFAVALAQVMTVRGTGSDQPVTPLQALQLTIHWASTQETGTLFHPSLCHDDLQSELRTHGMSPGPALLEAFVQAAGCLRLLCCVWPSMWRSKPENIVQFFQRYVNFRPGCEVFVLSWADAAAQHHSAPVWDGEASPCGFCLRAVQEQACAEVRGESFISWFAALGSWEEKRASFGATIGEGEYAEGSLGKGFVRKAESLSAMTWACCIAPVLANLVCVLFQDEGWSKASQACLQHVFLPHVSESCPGSCLLGLRELLLGVAKAPSHHIQADLSGTCCWKLESCLSSLLQQVHKQGASRHQITWAAPRLSED